MLARWFDRDGIGQYLAPDEKASKSPEAVHDTASSFWQIVAPDPNFQKAPPKAAFLSRPDHPDQVLCMHCNKWTDATTKAPESAGKDGPTAKTPVSKLSDPSDMFTPSPKSGYSGKEHNLEELVLSAAKETAMSMTSPPQRQETRDKVLRLCASQKEINDKLAKRLRNMLKKDPSLISVRSTHLGQLVPDGFTPLMATAYSNHTRAAKIILELAPSSAMWDRDLQGRTPLHIASELGHMDMIDVLLPKLEEIFGAKSPHPVDLLGKTPLGRALTSPNPSARKRQKQLHSKLFSPIRNDLSIFGNAKPESERAFQNPQLEIAYGIADMPGMRVTMEDAVCTTEWEQDGKTYCLLGVCDGHGDRGLVSQFVAENIPSILKKYIHEEDIDWEAKWQKTCLEVDDKLRQANISGGSTAVLALITKDLIVVANVGDSRAILVRSTETSGLETEMENMTISEKGDVQEETKLQEEGDETKAVTTVIALSEDHKPDLPMERSRIENAGMKVEAIKFMEDGQEVTIHKVAKSEKDMLACARSFGDFEYKGNSTLPPEEQAVIAVADVQVHTRDPDKDLYLILACDGIFDVMDNQQVMEFVLDQVEGRKEKTDTALPEVGDCLVRESHNCGSTDNMSVVIAALSKESTKIKPVIPGKTLDFNAAAFLSPKPYFP